MKRSLSSTPPTSPVEPSTTPPSAAKKSKTTSTPKNKRQPKSSLSGSTAEQNGELTPEKKALAMERIIEIGSKTVGLGDLADELGLSRTQLVNQFRSGRVGNMKDKAVKAVKGE